MTTSPGAKVALHPIVAELAASMQRSDDKSVLFFPPELVDKTRARIRAEASSNDDVLAHLLALAAKINRIAGEGGRPAMAALVLLVVERVGSVEVASDHFGAIGIQNASQLLGTIEPSRAPREQPKAAPAVKPKRGLSK